MPERACHAKINLALSVGPPIPHGPDSGLHPVCSWMCCVGLSDTLTLERASRTRHTRLWAGGSAVDWPEQGDLGVRAHRALEARTRRTLPAEIRLVKSIPAGGGLGGGSADAAGVLLGLRELFDLDCPIDTLRGIGATLGSDVAFFIDDAPVPAPALVTGTGSSIERLARLEAHVLLILPPFGCPTDAVYRAFDEQNHPATFAAASRRIRDAAHAMDLAALTNDLSRAAEAVRPELARLRLRIEHATGETVHLSGSGSTLFLLNPAADPVAVGRIAPGCRVIPTRAL